MVPIIQKLNKFFYKTSDCCEGHIEDKENFTCGYVVFEANWDDKTYLKLLELLPISLEIYRKDITTETEPFIIRYEIKIYCKDQIKYGDTFINDLNNFIDLFINWDIERRQ